MPYIWNESSITEATKCEIFGKWNACGVSIDTRKIKDSEVFIACRGANIDGHTYVKIAFSKNASAAIVEYIPEGLSENELAKLILVEDSIRALKDLALFNRARINAKIVAITGSVGKTSTKEAMYTALSVVSNTYCSPGNYNNDLGLLISMASMPLETTSAVFELGMSNVGEMKALTEILQPDVAVITIIAAVHLSNFDSIEAIANAKAEIFLGMNEKGVVFLNGDNEMYSLLKQKAEQKGISQIYSFGVSKGNDSHAISSKREDNFTLVSALILGEKTDYKIAAYGAHHIVNTLAVLSVVKKLGFDMKKAAKALEGFDNIKGRGKVLKIKINEKNILLVDDSYNASPESMKAAFSAMAEIKTKDTKRVVAILADMYELGENADNIHKLLFENIKQSKIDKVITVGELMKNLYDTIPEQVRIKHFENYLDAIEGIDKYIEDMDCVLVKGSFGTKIHKLVNYLEENQ